MADQPRPGGLAALLHNRLIVFLTAIALVLGIATEGLTLLRLLGETKNVNAQGDQAPVREPAIAQGAVSDAKIKDATAKYSEAKAKADAEQAEAAACKARIDAALATTPMNELMQKPADFWNCGAITGTTSYADKIADASRMKEDGRKTCFAELQALIDAGPDKGKLGFALYWGSVKDKYDVWAHKCLESGTLKESDIEKVNAMIAGAAGIPAPKSEITEASNAACVLKFKAFFNVAPVNYDEYLKYNDDTNPDRKKLIGECAGKLNDEGGAQVRELSTHAQLRAYMARNEGTASQGSFAPSAPTPTLPPPTAPAPVAPFVPPSPPPQKLVENVDFEGGDVAAYPKGVKGTSWQECQAKCSTVAGCVAVSYDKWNQACYLKSRVAVGYLNPRSVSIIYNGADWKKADTPQHISTREGCVYKFEKTDVLWQWQGEFGACVSKCDADAQCIAVNRSRVAKICFGVRAVNDRIATPDMDCAAKLQETPQ